MATKEFNDTCERAMLISSLEFGLEVTAYLEGETNLGPEETAIQTWRRSAKEAFDLAKSQPWKENES